jgi:CubicO group peptidase (beta-lactamase class C family)
MFVRYHFIMKSLSVLILVVAFYTHLFGQTKEAEIDEVMQYAATRGYFNGSIAVLEKGKTIYCNSFGYTNLHTKKKNDNTTLYELASVTKQFTAMAIMMLQEKGKLSYSDSLRKYFPELPYSGITIRHLLNHTSGMPDYIREIGFLYWDAEKVYDNRDAVQELVKYKLPVHFKPGEKFEYCNTGYMLLALIVEKVSSVSFENFITQHIFKPLDMKNSRLFPRYDSSQQSMDKNIAYGFVYDFQTNTYELPEHIPALRGVRSFGGLYGDGLIGSSINDMIKWELALATEKLVKKSTMQEAFTSGTLNNGQQTGYGFGWFLQLDPDGEFVAQHTGGWSGVRNAVVRWVDKDRILIVLRNSDVDFAGIQPAVKNILNGKPFEMPKPSLAQALAMVSNQKDRAVLRATFEELKERGSIIKEEEINILGYSLLETGSTPCAIEVLTINSELFPLSWNVFDSLGEVYLIAGNKVLAKQNFKKSLELNPQNDIAKKALKNL